MSYELVVIVISVHFFAQVLDQIVLHICSLMVSECLGTRTKSVGKVVMLLLEQSMIVSLSFLFRLHLQLSVQFTCIDTEGKGQVNSENFISDSQVNFESHERTISF